MPDDVRDSSDPNDGVVELELQTWGGDPLTEARIREHVTATFGLLGTPAVEREGGRFCSAPIFRVVVQRAKPAELDHKALHDRLLSLLRRDRLSGALPPMELRWPRAGPGETSRDDL